MNTIKDMYTKNNFAESHLYKNFLALFHLCKRKPEMLEEMKKYLLRNDNSGIADDLSNVTSIKLLILMDDKGIISMKNFGNLVHIFGKINPDLEKELSRIWFGLTTLSPKIKDFIAMQMRDEDWKSILRRKLPKMLEDSISRDNGNQYDRAYAVIHKLIEQKRLTCWSDMKNILDPINKRIVREVENKLCSQWEDKSRPKHLF